MGRDFRDELCGRVRGETWRDYPLAARTSVRVGGPAALFVQPADDEDLAVLLGAARALGQPVHVLGGGANTVVGDGGIPGVTVKLPSDASVERVTDRGADVELELSAGAPSARLVQLAREHRLVGAEWAAGIPGTVGGLVAMNAGTRLGEMKDVVREVLLCGPAGAEWVPAGLLRFAYRHAELGDRVATRVRLVLRRADESTLEASRAAMDGDREYRRQTQPLHLPNSGSVFRNPPGDHAGRLIEAAGLKRAVQGGAQISERHANFIVNRGGASAADVTTLMALAQRTVRERFQIHLALEVRLVGLFAPSLEILGLVVDR